MRGLPRPIYSYAPVALTLCVGIVLSAVGFRNVRDREQHRTRDEFERNAANLVAALEVGIARHLETLHFLERFCEGMAELIERFVARLPERIAAIEKVLAEDDAEALRSVSHQLKGAAGGFGFGLITDAARALEESVRAQEDRETVRQRAEEVVASCRRAQAALTAARVTDQASV